MRILLDECVPKRLKKHFRGQELVLTVTDAGLSSYTNGQPGLKRRELLVIE